MRTPTRGGAPRMRTTVLQLLRASVEAWPLGKPVTHVPAWRVGFQRSSRLGAGPIMAAFRINYLKAGVRKTDFSPLGRPAVHSESLCGLFVALSKWVHHRPVPLPHRHQLELGVLAVFTPGLLAPLWSRLHEGFSDFRAYHEAGE